MKKHILLSILAGIGVSALAMSNVGATVPDRSLQVVIIRHGEKPESGDNLSCQGEHRALQLPAVLNRKFKVPDHIYVPSLGLGRSTTHARMFQTVTPFAVKHNLAVNSEFAAKDYSRIADRVLKNTGTVLIVWEHSAIPRLARELGVNDPPLWKGKDFDSIWVITFTTGKASLSIDKQGIDPSPACNF